MMRNKGVAVESENIRPIPREPTEAMTEAGLMAIGTPGCYVDEVWRAMWDASPPIPAASAPKGAEPHLALNGLFRCEDGRRMQHRPQHDDPYLETDIGECPDCAGKWCASHGAEPTTGVDPGAETLLPEPVSQSDVDAYTGSLMRRGTPWALGCAALIRTLWHDAQAQSPPEDSHANCPIGAPHCPICSDLVRASAPTTGEA